MSDLRSLNQVGLVEGVEAADVEVARAGDAVYPTHA